MKFRLMTMIAVATMLGASGAQAQVLEEGLDELNAEAAELMLAEPIPLIEDEVTAQENIDLEAFDPTISYYVQNLNLTPKQLDEAQRISDEGHAKKEDLLRQIEALRREAENLEAGSLIAFEAILDDDQRAAFHELRNGIERADKDEQNSNDAETNLNPE